MCPIGIRWDRSSLLIRGSCSTNINPINSYAMIFSHYNQETRLTDWLQLTILTAREGSSIISALKECFSSCCSFRSFCLAALWASDLSVGLEIIKERFHTTEIIYFLYSSLLYIDNIIEEHQT